MAIEAKDMKGKGSSSELQMHILGLILAKHLIKSVPFIGHDGFWPGGLYIQKAINNWHFYEALLKLWAFLHLVKSDAHHHVLGRTKVFSQ